jgi:hypothetical protein
MIYEIIIKHIFSKFALILNWKTGGIIKSPTGQLNWCQFSLYESTLLVYQI